ncbi:hypothetical protein FQA47_023413 [Oryzias melastigma]|uniref:Uncharacterized protein n=1 Tax=Oryzias melastigma TaxID=30732 RepID=A0A834C2Q4_ORYME|nr:hypothetical protein FQA47_023413 [Oryzias melastigma]
MVVSVQHPSHSESSLATGSSEGSLQTTVEEGLRYGVSRLRDLNLRESLLCTNPRHSLCPPGAPAADQGQPLLKRRSTTTSLQASRRHKESQNSAKDSSGSAACPQRDSTNHSGEVENGSRGFCQTLNSEHLSETLNSLSLTSLFIPGSLAPTLIKKCNSTGSLAQSNLSAQREGPCHFYGIDAHGFLSNPWTEGKARGTEEDSDVTESRNHPTDSSSRKKR